MQLNYSNIFRVFLILLGSVCVAEKFEYISTEHPKTTYVNPKYLSFANVTSRRYGRGDPFYYVGVHFNILTTVSNNVSMGFYFFEWLTNVYKRSFVEMHYKACDLVHKDKIFGSALKQGKLLKPCPFPPGVYNLYNMTIPVKYVPANFPFSKGRIYCNITATDVNEIMASIHIDMEIKQYNTRKKKQN